MNQFDWIKDVTWTNGLTALGIFLFFIVLRKIFNQYFLKIVVKLSRRSQSQIDDKLFVAFQKPAAFFLLITGIYLGLTWLPLPPDWIGFINVIYRSAVIFAVGWGCFTFSDAISLFFDHMGNRFDMKFNEIIIPFLSRIVKVVVAILTISLILEQWNFHVSGLIAGLGIGGLAVAMAAKDTLSNFFGGLVIITDAPFTIGDYIQSGSIEGIVEDINFRSTKIRTMDQSLVTVPNSELANSPITNLSKMDKRRIFFTMPLDLKTSNEQLKKCIAHIREMLSDHPDVDQDGMLVYLDKITSTSIDLMIQFYVRTGDFEQWLKYKEKFNFAFLEIFSEEHVELATIRSQMVFESDQPTVPAPAGSRLTEERRPHSNDPLPERSRGGSGHSGE